jgi:hypothetical protein
MTAFSLWVQALPAKEQKNYQASLCVFTRRYRPDSTRTRLSASAQGPPEKIFPEKSPNRREINLLTAEKWGEKPTSSLTSGTSRHEAVRPAIFSACPSPERPASAQNTSFKKLLSAIIVFYCVLLFGFDPLSLPRTLRNFARNNSDSLRDSAVKYSGQN